MEYDITNGISPIHLVDYLSASLANETKIARCLSRMSDNAKLDNYMTYELCMQMRLERI